MVIDHASMLLRNHRSIGKMSNQGFEANHKVHRQLYAQATAHDSSEAAASCKFIFVHVYCVLFFTATISVYQNLIYGFNI